MAASPEVRAAIPGLAALAGQIGDLQVRNCGTLGGSIANNDPAADYPARPIRMIVPFAAGADTFVAGSAIYSTPDYQATIAAMRAQLATV